MINAAERALRDALEQKQKALEQVTTLLEANPYADILRLEQSVLDQTKELMKQGKTNDALKLLNEAQAERDRLIGIAKSLQDTESLIQQRVELTMEIAQISSAIMPYDIKRSLK